jgi:broad specificity phosphatase PhoE
MIEIIFEAHGTTFDNEAHLSSGHNDVELSPLGIQQSKEMGIRYKDDHFDAVFCSDLQRAYKSAEIGFGNKWPIIKDARLRECDYGDFTQHPSQEVDAQKPKRINEPFPNGESYIQTSLRMKDFLNFLRDNYDGKRVMIIGHRATQYGLDYWIDGIQYEQLVSTKFKWQPGWKYELYEEGKSAAVAEGSDFK